MPVELSKREIDAAMAPPRRVLLKMNVEEKRLVLEYFLQEGVSGKNGAALNEAFDKLFASMIRNACVRASKKAKISRNSLSSNAKNYGQALSRTERSGGPFVRNDDGT